MPKVEPPATNGLRLTAIGGGTGLAVLLRGLKHAVGSRVDALTAVVTVADDGGSSGRLRRAFGVLPPGDIRNCIVALADDEDLLARLFQYRFPDGDGLTGHSFGNLFLTALAGVTGDFYRAVQTAESVLSVRGRILPATLTDVRLRAAGRSGRIYEGESEVGSSGEQLTQLAMAPPDAVAFSPAVEALRSADLIVLGPGSLYTSILPNLLIPGIRRAIRESRAQVVLIMNLMTQPGETGHMDAVEHMRALVEHAGNDLIDAVLVNAAEPSDQQLAPYLDAGAAMVDTERSQIDELGATVVATDLLAEGPLIRHDPDKLRRAVLDLAEAAATQRPRAVAVP